MKKHSSESFRKNAFEIQRLAGGVEALLQGSSLAGSTFSRMSRWRGKKMLGAMISMSLNMCMPKTSFGAGF